MNTELEIVKKITLDLVKANPNKIFLYEDNDLRQKDGNFVEDGIREESNTVGIRIKKGPGENYYTDDEYEDNKYKIDEDFAKIPDGSIVVTTGRNIGTEAGQLHKKALNTCRYVTGKILSFKLPPKVS